MNSNIGYATLHISVTIAKILLWCSGMLLFIMAILNACRVEGANTQLFNNKDNGALILISVLCYTFISTLVNNRITKLIFGALFLGLAIAGTIGALINGINIISTWIIFVAEIIAGIGATIWLLEGMGTIKNNKKKYRVVTPMDETKHQVVKATDK